MSCEADLTGVSSYVQVVGCSFGMSMQRAVGDVRGVGGAVVVRDVVFLARRAVSNAMSLLERGGTLVNFGWFHWH